MKVLLAIALLAGIDERVDRLPKEHKDWIEKEVNYIIADKEREAFLDLESEEERVAFISAFWLRRDPDPLTPVNEFREEHYQRLEHANEYFGRESSVPGWMTDRGKIYIILGEPDDREDFTSIPMLYPTEVWFYRQNKEKGLPPLNLLFWQEHAVGPYRLFNHFLDQPEDLMPAQPLSSENSRADAYVTLQEMSPSLAHAAFTMRADQGAMANIAQPDRAGLDFQSLVSDIYVSPFRRVDTRYVDEAASARGLVESAYLFNYVPSSGMANVLPGPGGASFVHYSIEVEPQHMTLARDPDKNVYYTSFELHGEVTTAGQNEEAQVVYSFTKQPYMQLTESQFQAVGYRAFSYRDMFPLTEGTFRMRIVLKNQARSEYTIFESDLVVTERSDEKPFLGTPVPLYGIARRDPTEPPPYRTYQLGNVVLDPNAKRTVAIGNFLMAHVPVENAPSGHELRVRVVSRDDPSAPVVVEETHRLDFYEYPVVTRTPLRDAPGGHYRLVVDLLTPEGVAIASRQVEFDISPRVEIHRPWVLRESPEGEREGPLQAALAEQAMRLGDAQKARTLAAKALESDPNVVSARLMMARFYLDEGRFQDAIRLLEPARAQRPRDVEVLLALGDAHLQMKNFPRAIELLETAAEIRRPDTRMLNALGIAHVGLGNNEKAIEYLERSLELDPDQGNVRDLLKDLESSLN